MPNCIFIDPLSGYKSIHAWLQDKKGNSDYVDINVGVYGSGTSIPSGGRGKSKKGPGLGLLGDLDIEKAIQLSLQILTNANASNAANVTNATTTTNPEVTPDTTTTTTTPETNAAQGEGQTGEAAQGGQGGRDNFDPEIVNQLVEMGFSEEQVKEALVVCNFDADAAALHLFGQ
jgi:hypothetical protein